MRIWNQKRQPPQQRKKKPAMPTNAMASNRETIRKIIASKKPIWRFNRFHLKSLRNFHFHESLSLWKLNTLLFFVFVFLLSIASSIRSLSKIFSLSVFLSLFNSVSTRFEYGCLFIQRRKWEVGALIA